MKLRYTPGKFQGHKWERMKIQHDIFLINHIMINHWSFHFFFSWPLEFSWNFHIIFFQYPWNFHCLFFSFLLIRCGLTIVLCPMIPVVIIFSLSKFGMFTFVVSYTICLSVFFWLVEEARILDFWWENKKGEIFGGRWNKPPLNETMAER